MIRPPRGSCAFIVATASRAHRNAPVRFTATVDSHPSTGISSTSPTGPNVPALLTSRSTRPHSPRTAANSSATDAGSATSVGTTSAASAPPAVSAERLGTPPGERDAPSGVEQSPGDHPPDSGSGSRHHSHVARHETAP